MRSTSWIHLWTCLLLPTFACAAEVTDPATDEGVAEDDKSRAGAGEWTCRLRARGGRLAENREGKVQLHEHGHWYSEVKFTRHYQQTGDLSAELLWSEVEGWRGNRHPLYVSNLDRDVFDGETTSDLMFAAFRPGEYGRHGGSPTFPHCEASGHFESCGVVRSFPGLTEWTSEFRVTLTRRAAERLAGVRAHSSTYFGGDGYNWTAENWEDEQTLVRSVSRAIDDYGLNAGASNDNHNVVQLHAWDPSTKRGYSFHFDLVCDSPSGFDGPAWWETL